MTIPPLPGPSWLEGLPRAPGEMMGAGRGYTIRRKRKGNGKGTMPGAGPPGKTNPENNGRAARPARARLGHNDSSEPARNPACRPALHAARRPRPPRPDHRGTSARVGLRGGGSPRAHASRGLWAAEGSVADPSQPRVPGCEAPEAGGGCAGTRARRASGRAVPHCSGAALRPPPRRAVHPPTGPPPTPSPCRPDLPPGQTTPAPLPFQSPPPHPRPRRAG